MLIAIDIGNTQMVLGLFDKKSGDLLEKIRISTDISKTADELAFIVLGLFSHKNYSLDDVDDVIISSVVPQIMYAMEKLCSKYFNIKPMIVGPGIKTGLNILYDNPKEVGADRIINAVYTIKKYGYPSIIIDFGTATTFCVIDRDCNYLGGLIMPGIKVSTEALTNRAAKLQRVDLKRPSTFVCRNTVDSVKSGIINSEIGAVEYIVKNIKEEVALPNDTPVIATGGLASLISDHTDYIDVVDDDLSLMGLYEIYRLNKNENR